MKALRITRELIAVFGALIALAFRLTVQIFNLALGLSIIICAATGALLVLSFACACYILGIQIGPTYKRHWE